MRLHECRGTVTAIFWLSLFTDLKPSEAEKKVNQRLTELKECPFCEKPIVFAAQKAAEGGE